MVVNCSSTLFPDSNARSLVEMMELVTLEVSPFKQTGDRNASSVLDRWVTPPSHKPILRDWSAEQPCWFYRRYGVIRKTYYYLDGPTIHCGRIEKKVCFYVF
jgi:hypothetical protein